MTTSADPAEWHNLVAGGEFSTEHAAVIQRLSQWLPKTNADPVPGSAGSDSPLYGEGKIPLNEAMKRAADKVKAKP